jgi:superfamily I DNA and/or RNA helicase
VFFVIERIVEILKLKYFKSEEIVILSLYLAQLAIYVKALQKIYEKYLNSGYNRIRVSNIEKFQKLEIKIVFFDIIFIDEIDFFRDLRRFITALSRAKYSLYLMLNVKSIENYCQGNGT